MKRSVFQVFVVVTISSFILASSPSPLRYSGLSRLSPYSADLNFESLDQEDQLKDHSRGLGTFLSNVFSAALFPGTRARHFKTTPRFSCLAFSLDERTIFLRC